MEREAALAPSFGQRTALWPAPLVLGPTSRRTARILPLPGAPPGARLFDAFSKPARDWPGRPIRSPLPRRAHARGEGSGLKLPGLSHWPGSPRPFDLESKNGAALRPLPPRADRCAPARYLRARASGNFCPRRLFACDAIFAAAPAFCIRL